jgi:hypothetical protein
MRTFLYITSALFAAAMVLGALQGTASADDPWGEKIGPVSAVVEKAKNPKGLTVHSNPARGTRVLGYLPVGTQVRGYRKFTNGWMKLYEPFRGGWVRIRHLGLVSGAGTVVSIDRPENCLRIRSGPSMSHEIIGCARMDEAVKLTGVWSEDNWAEVTEPTGGWVYAKQISSDLKPPPQIGGSRVRSAERAGQPKNRHDPTLFYEGDPEYRTKSRRARSYRYGPAVRLHGYYAPGVGVHIGRRGGVGVYGPGIGVGVGPHGRGAVGFRSGGVGVRIGF